MTIPRRATITTVLSYSSIEEFFLPQSAYEASLFSDHLIIVICDHLFDGTKENLSRIKEVINKCPKADVIIYPFLPDSLLTKKLHSRHGRHNISRILATKLMPPSTDYILFLDADEVPEGKVMKQWLEERDLFTHDAYKFACYWYFREVKYQAKEFETAALLIRKKVLTPKLLWHKGERGGLFRDYKGKKMDWITDKEGRPFFHHYSWVRSKENLLKKVESWGHKGEKNWKELVEEECCKPFQGKDFVHGYEYKTITPPFSFEQKTISHQVLHFISKGQLIQILFGKIAYWKLRVYSYLKEKREKSVIQT